ncbi:hypothetical protein J437_LFUL005441 [Ladona fulva]|uniref:Nucleic-acid-binding protein from transposon X-element n=1 Tax=Ladona fulva TaxID=123851 RepID=A0A8K0JWE5_LADFU|nr:hypothetical protein J437_LFUL005441 [Ladona fulva]
MRHRRRRDGEIPFRVGSKFRRRIFRNDAAYGFPMKTDFEISSEIRRSEMTALKADDDRGGRIYARILYIISHSSINSVSFQPNCVKCGGPHHSSNCQKDTTDKPKCYLCKQQHTANYRGCNVYLRAKEALRNRNRQQTPLLSSATAFPSLPQRTTLPNPSHAPNWPNTTTAPQSTPEDADLHTWFMAILNKVNSVQSTIEKKTIILSELLKLHS